MSWRVQLSIFVLSDCSHGLHLQSMSAQTQQCWKGTRVLIHPLHGFLAQACLGGCPQSRFGGRRSPNAWQCAGILRWILNNGGETWWGLIRAWTSGLLRVQCLVGSSRRQTSFHLMMIHGRILAPPAVLHAPMFPPMVCWCVGMADPAHQS